MSRLPGITQSLNAPGVAPEPLVTDPTLKLVQDTLGAIGVTFGNLADQARRDRLEQERMDEKHETVLRGEGAFQAGVDLQGFQSQIEEGKIAVPSSYDEVLTLADKLVSERTNGTAAPYADRYRQGILAPLVSAMENRRSRNADDAKAELGLKISAGLTGETDPMRWSQAFNYAKDTLQLNEVQSYSLIARAMQANAAQGHEGAVAAAKGLLGDRFIGEQADADGELRRITTQQRVESDRAMSDESRRDLELIRRGELTEAEGMERVAKRYADAPDLGQASIESFKDQLLEWRTEQDAANNAKASEAASNAIQHAYRHINDGNPQQAIAFANRERAKGTLSQTQASSIINAAQSDLSQQQNRMIALERRAAEQAAVGNAVAAFREGGLPQVQKFTQVLSDGETEASVSQEALRKAAIDTTMQQIAAENRQDPQAALAIQVQALARNGARYDFYADTMQAGARAALVDLLGGERAEGEVQINQNTIAGFELYRNMRAISKNVADDHLDDTSKTFYRYAQAAFEFGPDRGNAERSLAEAAKIMGDPETAEFRAGLVNRKAILDKVNAYDFKTGFLAIGAGDIRNREDLARITYERARTMALINLGSEAATQAAIDTLKTDVEVVNHFGVVVSRSNMPRQYIAPAGEVAIEAFWKQHGPAMQEQGIDREDLTLAPVDQNTWIVVRGSSGEPVSMWSDGGFFTNSQLLSLVGSDARAKADAKAREVAQNQNKRERPLFVGQGENPPMDAMQRAFNGP